MNDPHALARRFPAARALPHAPLGDFPTPVEHLERAGEELGLPDLFIKRDDRSGKEYGGNKVRKLEFALAHARAQGHDDIVTIGAIGSHHVLATSIYARQLGMRPSAQHWPQPVTPHVRDNLRALSTTQPTLRLIGHPVEVPFHVFKRHLNDWLADRPRTYFLSGGGSSPHGVLGYVNAALELAEQIDAGLAPEPDVVFVAAGTNGTYAGLLLGAKMAGLRAKFIAVRVVEKIVTNTANVLRLTHQAAQLLRSIGVAPVPEVLPREVHLLGGYLGDAYGAPTQAADQAIAMLERTEHVHLDPTYTGKAFSAIVGERERLALASKRVLYWHTLSSADLSSRLARADVQRDLPAEYMTFFTN